jgi:hypothetical protein
LATATVGAIALLFQSFGTGLADESSTRGQPGEERPSFGALSRETVALVVTESAIGVAPNVRADDDDDEDDSQDGGPQGLLKKQSPAPSEEGVSIESLRLGVAKTGYVNRCWEGANDVTVVVKNNLQKVLEGVLVRVYSDNNGDRAVEQVIASLGAGESYELGLDDVYIKKGNHKLTATARSVSVVSPALTASSASSYASKTIRVKCDATKDKETKEEA